MAGGIFSGLFHLVFGKPRTSAGPRAPVTPPTPAAPSIAPAPPPPTAPAPAPVTPPAAAAPPPQAPSAAAPGESPADAGSDATAPPPPGSQPPAAPTPPPAEPEPPAPVEQPPVPPPEPPAPPPAQPPSPPAEQPAPPVEQPAPPAEQPAPPVEQPAPPAEQPSAPPAEPPAPPPPAEPPAAASPAPTQAPLSDSTKLSPHFTLGELTVSATARARGISNYPPTSEMLENLRTAAAGMERVRAALGNLPITINSAYRNEEVNRLVGGVPNSDHTKGFSVDFVCPSYGAPYDIARKLAADAELMQDVDQLIYEFGKWIHISFAPQRRKQILTAYYKPETGKQKHYLPVVQAVNPETGQLL